MVLSTIRSQQDLKDWAIGSDSDIGGFSTAKLEVYPPESSDAGKGRFFGQLSSKVKPGAKLGGNAVERSGYAGIRTRVCQSSILGRLTFTEALVCR